MDEKIENSSVLEALRQLRLEETESVEDSMPEIKETLEKHLGSDDIEAIEAIEDADDNIYTEKVEDESALKASTPVIKESIMVESSPATLGEVDEAEKEFADRKTKRIAAYRKYAKLKNEALIEESSLNRWAINKVAMEENYPSYWVEDELLGREYRKLEGLDSSSGTLENKEYNNNMSSTKSEEVKVGLLNEDSGASGKATGKYKSVDDAVKNAQQALDSPNVVSTAGDIEDSLDRALKVNLRNQRVGIRQFENILFIGPAGSGKTARIEAWAKKNNINLVKVLASVMDDTDLGGAIVPGTGEHAGTVHRLASTEFDELGSVPRSVLFLDEWNRANKNVRGTLLTLIQDHVIRDDRLPGKSRYLPNFLFTIAAVNPANANYNTDELDDAERSRFKEIDVGPDPANLLRYLTATLSNEIEQLKNSPEDQAEVRGQLGIATALLSNKEFTLDSPSDIDRSKESGNGLILSSRTFTNCLLDSNGTKADFLANWNRFCNSLKFTMVERILKNYQDVKDKANDAIRDKSTSSVFAQREDSYTRLKAAADSMPDKN